VLLVTKIIGEKWGGGRKVAKPQSKSRGSDYWGRKIRKNSVGGGGERNMTVQKGHIQAGVLVGTGFCATFSQSHDECT